jgi:long-subunit fatty acid transport protein
VVNLLSSSSPAHASTADVFSCGSRAGGLSGAVSALADDFSAAFYNPGGLVLSKRPSLSAGLFLAGSQLSVNKTDPDIRSSFGIWIGAALPIPLGGVLRDRLFAGIAYYHPTKSLLYEIGGAYDDLSFALFQNRIQRDVILPALAFRFTDGWGLGIGANAFAGATGGGGAIEGPSRSLEAATEIALTTVVAPVVGLRGRIAEGLDFSLFYRGEFSVPFDITIDSRIADRVVKVHVRSRTLYTPSVWGAGLAVRPTSRLRLALDAAWEQWGRFSGSVVLIDGQLPTVGTPPIATLNPPQALTRFFDIITVRAGAEWDFFKSATSDTRLTARLGLRVEPTPIPPQRGATNLADADKLGASLGFGLAQGALRIDMHIDAIFLGTIRIDKDPARIIDESTTAGLQTTNPGYPQLHAGGSVWSGGLTITGVLP